jgi:hypothetical protein
MGIAAYLSKHFKGRVADILAVRLVKGTDWPEWSVLGVLFYLWKQKQASATAALIRFAIETPKEKWRRAAVKAIQAAADPDLQAKLAWERRRLREQEKLLPPALRDLEAP